MSLRHRSYQHGSHSPLTVVPSQVLSAAGQPKSPRKVLAGYASEASALPSTVHIPMLHEMGTEALAQKGVPRQDAMGRGQDWVERAHPLQTMCRRGRNPLTHCL